MALPLPEHSLFGWLVLTEDVKLARVSWALIGNALVFNPKVVLDGQIQQGAKHICDNAGCKKTVVGAAKLGVEGAIAHRDDQARLGHFHKAAVEHCAEPHVEARDRDPQGAQAASDAKEDEAERPADESHPLDVGESAGEGGG